MKTLIAYASKYGCAEKCTNSLKEKLGGEVDIKNLQSGKFPDISGYDTVIIGGSIYGGKIQGAVSRFCQSNLNSLLKKKVGLFVCCADSEKAHMQLKAAVPASLFEHATAKGHFGHEFDLKKMKFIDRTIIKSMLKIKESQFNILHDNINKFVEKIKS